MRKALYAALTLALVLLSAGAWAAWPTGSIDTTHLDQDTDSPLSARPSLKQAVDQLNAIRDHGEPLLKSGGTATGPISVPAGATGTQVPQIQEVYHNYFSFNGTIGMERSTVAFTAGSFIDIAELPVTIPAGKNLVLKHARLRMAPDFRLEVYGGYSQLNWTSSTNDIDTGSMAHTLNTNPGGTPYATRIRIWVKNVSASTRYLSAADSYWLAFAIE